MKITFVVGQWIDIIDATDAGERQIYHDSFANFMADFNDAFYIAILPHVVTYTYDTDAQQFTGFDANGNILVVDKIAKNKKSTGNAWATGEVIAAQIADLIAAKDLRIPAIPNSQAVAFLSALRDAGT